MSRASTWTGLGLNCTSKIYFIILKTHFYVGNFNGCLIPSFGQTFRRPEIGAQDYWPFVNTTCFLVKGAVSWLGRAQWSGYALLPCLLRHPALHRLRVTTLSPQNFGEKLKKGKEVNWEIRRSMAQLDYIVTSTVCAQMVEVTMGRNNSQNEVKVYGI